MAAFSSTHCRHTDEASCLWALRGEGLASLRCSSGDHAKLDRRVEAHVNGPAHRGGQRPAAFPEATGGSRLNRTQTMRLLVKTLNRKILC